MLVCKECGDKFIWTAGAQQFFRDKGLQNIPKRCRDCGAKYKEQLREKHRLNWIQCRICKKKAEVPFKPKNDDVLCQECFDAEIEKRNELILKSGESLPE